MRGWQRWRQTAEAHRDRLTVVEVARGGARVRVVVHVMVVGLDGDVGAVGGRARVTHVAGYARLLEHARRVMSTTASDSIRMVRENTRRRQ